VDNKEIIVKITGIAHPPEWLHERSNTASPELVFLAKKALKEYCATHLITSLAFGWEQALAKAANELKIPFTVALPFPGRDLEWNKEDRGVYYEMLAKAAEVYQVSDCYSENAILESHFWRVDRADIILALWDYEFRGNTFNTIDYGLKLGKEVVNLWKDWYSLYHLRKMYPSSYTRPNKRGAQIFEGKGRARFRELR